MGAPSLFLARTAASATTRPYSPNLQRVLQRLNAQVDWESRLRTGPDSMASARLSNDPAIRLLDRLGNPHRGLRAVHITGSKGKGSVGALVAAALQRAALTDRPIGTYGSPHVERVTERVRLDGAPIGDDAFATALERVLAAREATPPLAAATWFDVVSVTGLVAFADAAIRWAVVEVGMGGRLDSTNVLGAPVGVVTNISMEHADIIGPTLRDIAYEKAGIIAPGAHVVCGMASDDALANIFVEEAQSKSPPALVRFYPPPGGSSLFDHNLILARAAVDAVLLKEGRHTLDASSLLTESVAKQAMTTLPARQESFSVCCANGKTSDRVHVLLDGAHVPTSVSQVLQEVKFDCPPVIVVGMGREKDAEGICKVIQSAQPQHIFATAVSAKEQYLSATEVAQTFRNVGVSAVTAVDDADIALEMAVERAFSSGASVVVIGSLHLAGRLRPSLRMMQDA